MKDVEETPGQSPWALPALVGAMVFAALSVGSVVGYKIWTTRDDTGVTACEAMTYAKDNGQTPDPTEEKWRKARDQFEQSRYPDIKSAGVDFIDIAQQISNAPKDSMVVTSLTLLPQMSDAYTRLDTACQGHGYDLPAWGDL